MRIVSYLLSSLFLLTATSAIYAGNPVTETKVKEILLNEVVKNPTLKGDPGPALTVTAGTGGIVVTPDANIPVGYTIAYAPTAPMNPGLGDAISDTFTNEDIRNSYIGCITASGGIKNLVYVTSYNNPKFKWSRDDSKTGAISRISGFMNSELVKGNILAEAMGYCRQLSSTESNNWYLPSLEELQCLRANKGDSQLPSLPDGDYWSSTEDITDGTKAFLLNTTAANYQTFSDNKEKISGYDVLCVREFKFVV